MVRSLRGAPPGGQARPAGAYRRRHAVPRRRRRDEPAPAGQAVALPAGRLFPPGRQRRGGVPGRAGDLRHPGRPVRTLRQGEFRQDLYHRLNVLSLHIPPLRECLDGLAPLAEHFLDQASRQIGCGLPKLSAQALERLERYHWPGNVRQLENDAVPGGFAVRRGTVRAEHIRLPDYGAPQPLGIFPWKETSTPSSGASRRRCWSACSANIRAAASWASASAFRIPRRRTSCASMAWGKARAERHACRFVAGWERNGGGVGPCERAAAR